MLFSKNIIFKQSEDMITLFENNDLRLELTGHFYDFVGTIEVKSNKTLTFFFHEELNPMEADDEDCDEWEVAEDETELAGICENMSEEEAEDYASLNCYSHFTHSKDNDWMGFLSSCQQRGWFLALVKNYCPEQLKNIPWA